MMHTVFELDVRLRDIEPAIWRTIEVAGSATLEDVHFALQIAMGWTNSHLHSFSIGGRHFGMSADDGDDDVDLEDESEVRLEDVAAVGDSFLYEYDFGDGWEHDVKVSRVTRITKPPRPRCTAGERACPPEDCGGVPGYENLLRALADPDHEEHEQAAEWAEGFEPEGFAVPANGLDLSAGMRKLKQIADEQMDALGDGIGLPPQLVNAVLDLPPPQRAALATAIVQSLADQLTEVLGFIEQAAAQERRAHKPARRGGRRRK